MAKKKNNKNNDVLEVYTEEQAQKIEEHIEEHFGEIQNFFSEKTSEGIKLTINSIPPSRKNPYHTLVTSGMGAHIMNVPKDLKKKKLERAELVICLPPDWDFENETQEYYWSLHLLSLIARLPIRENAWLGWGHSIDYGTTFADNVPFSAVVIVNSKFSKESCSCDISENERVNFYQVVPLFENELAFKNKNGASALLEMFPDKNDSIKIIDLNRKCYVPDNFRELLDDVRMHSKKIKEKKLDVLEINAANHIAAFLHWSSDNGLLNSDFFTFFAEDIEQIKTGKYDIRKFVINSLGGELTTEIYNEDGKKFCEWYYDHYAGEDEPCYPRDVDRMALDYFGEEKYNCDEFDDEAYLFVPFDEEYYKNICKYIDEKYSDFQMLNNEDFFDKTIHHIFKIRSKKLDIPEKNGVNHMAAFLNWCIAMDLMSGFFMEYYANYAQEIRSGELDMRDFILDNLSGELPYDMFTEEGEKFVRYYYQFGKHEHSTYPADVDKMALAYFGEEKYNCDEFQNEAYLFVPFNEDYCEAMYEFISKGFDEFHESIIIDSKKRQVAKIKANNVKAVQKNAMNHIAAFVVWCTEHRLMNKFFMMHYAVYREDLESGKMDIRALLKEYFKNQLSEDMLIDEGIEFAHFYYNFECPPPSYPDDVNKMALEYFGEEKYNSARFDGMAYLFVPFDENYIKKMKEYIDRAYDDFCYFKENGKLPDEE